MMLTKLIQTKTKTIKKTKFNVHELIRLAWPAMAPRQVLELTPKMWLDLVKSSEQNERDETAEAGSFAPTKSEALELVNKHGTK